MTALTTTDQIETFRLITLRSALKLEIKGMKGRGQSAYKILKSMGFTGLRQSVKNKHCTTLAKHGLIIKWQVGCGLTL